MRLHRGGGASTTTRLKSRASVYERTDIIRITNLPSLVTSSLPTLRLRNRASVWRELTTSKHDNTQARGSARDLGGGDDDERASALSRVQC